MKKLIILPLTFVTVIIMSHFPSGNSANPPPPKFGLYPFGDSLVDSGNNNWLLTLSKVNYPPYGMDFHKGATGRFTNGKTIVDFIAEFVGLPYAPPYENALRAVLPLDQLSRSVSPLDQLPGLVLRPDELTGVNFASGSCGILPKTGSQYGKCLTLVDQVNLFERITKQGLPRYYQNSDELSNYLAKSIFVMSFGSNDYLNNYLDILQNKSSSSFAQLLINNLSLQLQRLYKLGARKVLVLEIGPIGCIPYITRQFKPNGTQCVEEINKLIVSFNDQLAPMLQNLTTTLEGSDFVLVRSYDLAYDTITNPSNHGMIDSTKACCAIWPLANGTATCIPGSEAIACRDREKRYFWDGYHPTEAVHRTIASLCFDGSSVCIPKNIKQLLLQS